MAFVIGNANKMLLLLFEIKALRAVVSNFRESGDRAENSNFFLFAQKNPFGELFSKIIFKSSSQFLFWQKTESSKLA